MVRDTEPASDWSLTHVRTGVCGSGDALDRARLDRELPAWQGCRRIADGDIFLMNPDVRDSLDGRYFGPTITRLIEHILSAFDSLDAWTGRENESARS